MYATSFTMKSFGISKLTVNFLAYQYYLFIYFNYFT